MELEMLERGGFDTVLVAMVDMQGRIMGKRYTVPAFLVGGHMETHCCDYLLATDLEMATPSGYAASSWERGYGDYVMCPDLATLRPVPWEEGTALVLCDVLDHRTHEPVPHSPRTMLKRQVERAAAMGLVPMMATELEFFLFRHSYDDIRRSGFRDLEPLVGYNQDYNLLQSARDECVMRPIRNGLLAAGVPVESSKGEAETGQEELNIRYADALACADHHAIAKQAVKQIADAHGHAASFLPKWAASKVGSAAHIHQSMFRGDDNAFHDPDRPHGMSALFGSYLGGLTTHTAEQAVFLAPYVNSYKRFAPGTFAPTKLAWSVDNRTAGYRLVGEGAKSVRIECRIPGSDINPYLSCAAQIAAGLAGVEAGLDAPEPVSGDVYDMIEVPDLPANLRDAAEALRGSTMLRAAFGDGVVDHYVRMAEVEIEAFDAAITDWEIARGFERA